MALLLDRTHLLCWRALGRINSAILLGLVGGGLCACMLGAFAYDVHRLIALW
jgi:hypothetical protein